MENAPRHGDDGERRTELLNTVIECQLHAITSASATVDIRVNDCESRWVLTIFTACTDKCQRVVSLTDVIDICR